MRTASSPLEGDDLAHLHYRLLLASGLVADDPSPLVLTAVRTSCPRVERDDIADPLQRCEEAFVG